MLRPCFVLVLPLLTSAIVLAAPALQPSVTSGGSMFNLYCSSCHGTSGRGDGPMASKLRPKPADLTLIAKRGGGTFDADMVARIIDGRSPVKGHGGGEMPAWGDALANSADQTPVESRIRTLVSYIESIQARP